WTLAASTNTARAFQAAGSAAELDGQLISILLNSVWLENFAAAREGTEAMTNSVVKRQFRYMLGQRLSSLGERNLKMCSGPGAAVDKSLKDYLGGFAEMMWAGNLTGLEITDFLKQLREGPLP